MAKRRSYRESIQYFLGLFLSGSPQMYIFSSRTDQEMTRYLLGELSPAEMARIEEYYLMDHAYYEKLLDIEDELIHEYVTGELAGRERELFEKNFLSIPQNREKVKLAKMVKAHLTKEQPQGEPARFRFSKRIASWLSALVDFLTSQKVAWKLAYVMAIVVMIFYTSRLFIKTNELGIQIDQFERERHSMLQQQLKLQRQLQNERNRRAALAEELSKQQSPKPKAQSLKPIFFTITLKPGISRSAQSANKLNLAQIKQQAQLLEIQLLLEDPRAYESYRVFLVTASEDTVLIKYGLQAQKIEKGEALILQLPTSDLSDDEYQITVKGVTASREIEHVDSYQLSVKKE